MNPYKKTMTNDTRSRKLDRALLLFAIAYSAITLYFISGMLRDQSASLGYVILFPVFWAIAGLLLGLLFWLKKVKIQTLADKITLGFSTPIPLVVFIFIWTSFSSSENPTMTREYNKNGHRYREVFYEYSPGNRKRIEYYKSQDNVNDESPFPKSNIWAKDSIWTYYKRDGQIERAEDYRSNK